MPPYLEFVLLHIILLTKNTAGSNVCRASFSDTDHILTGHVIRTLQHKTFESCTFSCELEPRCFSVNYMSALKICELNEATKEYFPEDVVEQKGAFYMGMVVRRYHPQCGSMRCENGGRCVSSPSLKCKCPEGYNGLRCENLQALGMENKHIPNKDIESSTFLQGFDAWKGRLNGKSCWRPAQNKDTEYIKVTFPSKKTVIAIATQGNPDSYCWIKSYTFQWFDGNLQNSGQRYQANVDTTSIVTNKFLTPLQNVQWIRIHPQTWFTCVALRLELYGY